MLTRSERGNLIRTGKKNFENLKDEMINGEVADLAVSFHGILTIISAKYSNDAVVDLIPELTLTLNKLDASLKVNEDLKQNLAEIYEENQLLSKSLDKEKNMRKLNLNDSLQSEEMAYGEISLLKNSVTELEQKQKILLEEIKSKNKIIEMLNIDYNNLAGNLNSNMNQFAASKHSIKPKTPSTTTTIHTENRFSVLQNNIPSSPSYEVIQTRAQVHRPSTPPFITSSPATKTLPKNTPQEMKKEKKKLTVMSDSQGKDIYWYVKGLEDEFDVFVYCLPGAKMKNVVTKGLKFVENYSEHDFIIVLAGSNDVNTNEPAQLTITQGINKLLSLANKTNVFVNYIPYRYDDPSLNDRIFFCNKIMTKMIRNYQGNLNVICDDVVSTLRRVHFTRHGLHYSRKGKQFLGEYFITYIRDRLGDSLLTPRSSTEQEVQHTSPGQHHLTTSPSPRHSDSMDAILPFPEITSTISSSTNLSEPRLTNPDMQTSLSFTNVNPSIMSSPLPPTDVSMTFSLPGSLQQPLDLSTTSEPWGNAMSTSLPNHFLDLHSWPHLQR